MLVQNNYYLSLFLLAKNNHFTVFPKFSANIQNPGHSTRRLLPKVFCQKFSFLPSQGFLPRSRYPVSHSRTSHLTRTTIAPPSPPACARVCWCRRRRIKLEQRRSTRTEETEDSEEVSFDMVEKSLRGNSHLLPWLRSTCHSLQYFWDSIDTVRTGQALFRSWSWSWLWCWSWC